MKDCYLITLPTFEPGCPPAKFVTNDLLKVAEKYDAFMVDRLTFKNLENV